jgi:signal recognition particle receptor subunit beta
MQSHPPLRFTVASSATSDPPVGHRRVRGRATQSLSDAKAIIFVIDGVAFRAREAAEHLFELLSNKQVRQLRLPFLVCVNKTDILSAQAPEALRAELEREMCVFLWSE